MRTPSADSTPATGILQQAIPGPSAKNASEGRMLSLKDISLNTIVRA